MMGAELGRRYQGLADCVVVDYTGITATEADELRTVLAGKDARLEVLRNRVALVALRSAGLDSAARLISGPSAIVSGGDIPGVCKAITGWAKEHQKLVVRGGTLHGRLISSHQVQELADIPPIQVLYAQAAGLIQAPARGIASAIQQIHSRIAMALEGIRKKKEDGAG